MKKRNKILTLVLALSMLVGMMIHPVSAVGGNRPSQIVKEGGKIYYLASGEEASADNYDVWTSKTIAETGVENEFEITLQVGTTKKAKTEDIAVVLVMDVSSSMLKDKAGKWTINNTGWNNYMPVEGPLMIDYARETAKKFVTGLVNHAGDASIKLAMVEFGNNARTVLNFTEANNGGTVNGDILDSIERLDVGFSIDESEVENCTWYNNVANASFWGPVRDESGRCYYKEADGSYCELTDPFHTHNSKDADLCYWVERHASFWDKNTASCLYEGCENTDQNHMHEVEGCTYIFDNQPCTDTTPFHYHKFNLSDVDASNDTFGWNTNGTMYKSRYVLTDENGAQHLCVDYEILRQKSGGTNMEGGLLLANNLLDAGLAEGGAIEGYENVYVIMLSDGEPTWGISTDDSRTSLNVITGQRGTSSKCEWSEIKNIVSDGTEGDLAYAEDIKEKAAFYTVMYGYLGDKAIPEAGQVPEGVNKTTVKEWLVGTGNHMVGIDDLYMAQDVESGLLEAFGNIGERIEVLSKAWTVTDELSDEVIFDKFTLNADFAEYDKEAHAITWHVGDMEPEKADATGTVEDPYIYTLKYMVKLDPDYPGVFEASEAGTGVNTNKRATLSYLMVDEEEDLKKLPYDELVGRAQEAAFDHPAVKAYYPDTTEVMQVSVEKLWDDDEDFEGARPESITIRLFANGEEVAVQVVTAEDGWTYTFENLPAYADGQAIVYTVAEDAVEGYVMVELSGDAENGFKVVNQYQIVVEDPEPPKTGDPIALVLALSVISVLGMAVIVLQRKKFN